ncbi:MAG: C39 family peptidase [Acidobacteriales bacterium]|nr:C39 family peptidase [Terriglobales bacterium]
MLRRARRLFPCFALCFVTSAAQSSVVQLDVPFVKQERNGCGAASIAMVMQYWQRQRGLPQTASAPEIQRALYSKKARGIYASAMEEYLRRNGFRPFAVRGEWQDLKHHLTMGRPLIVALKPKRGDLHYVVVTGLDWAAQIVLKHDPAERGMLRQHRSDFEREWSEAGNWTLLAVPDTDGGSSP